jgi:hypothetical protein
MKFIEIVEEKFNQYIKRRLCNKKIHSFDPNNLPCKPPTFVILYIIRSKPSIH